MVPVKLAIAEKIITEDLEQLHRRGKFRLPESRARLSAMLRADPYMVLVDTNNAVQLNTTLIFSSSLQDKKLKQAASSQTGPRVRTRFSA